MNSPWCALANWWVGAFQGCQQQFVSNSRLPSIVKLSSSIVYFGSSLLLNSPCSERRSGFGSLSITKLLELLSSWHFHYLRQNASLTVTFVPVVLLLGRVYPKQKRKPYHIIYAIKRPSNLWDTFIWTNMNWHWKWYVRKNNSRRQRWLFLGSVWSKKCVIKSRLFWIWSYLRDWHPLDP